METALKKLIEILLPPENPTGREVDWTRFEHVLGFTYPTTFKDFIAVYGASIFLDNYTHFYPAGSTVHDVETFYETVSSKLSMLVDYDLSDQDYNPVKAPVYPESDGLFPFMMDYSSNEYFWQMGNADPDKWPIICWMTGALKKLEFASLPELLLADIEHWKVKGPDRICVVRWIEPTQPPPRRDEIENPAGAFESAIQRGHETLLKKASLVKAMMDQRGGSDFRG